MASYQFLEEYVLSDERDDLIGIRYPEESEEYWYYKLLTLQARARLGDDEAVGMIPDTCDIIKSKFPETTQKTKDLLFKQQIVDFGDESAVAVGSTLRQRLEPKDRRKMFLNHEQDESALEPDARPVYKSTIQVKTAALLKSKFSVKEQLEGTDHIFKTFSANSTDYIAEQDKRGKLNNEDIAGLMKLMDDSPPAAPYLLTLIKKDIDNNGINFGERKLHARLTCSDMETLLQKSPDLISNAAFCQQFVKKMRPVSDGNLILLQQPADLLNRILKFASSLKNQVSFQAMLIYNILRTFEQQGEKDVAYGSAFKTYLSFRRFANLGYLKQKKRTKGELTEANCVKNNFVCADIPEFKAIGNDMPFVKRAVMFRFTSGKGIKDIVGSLAESFHRVLYAEYFLTNTDNIGNKKKEKAFIAQQEIYREFGYSYQDLVGEVNLQLAPDNRAFYKTGDPVILKLLVKNVQRLLVNVYEVDGKNYYLQNQREVPEDIDLSGSSPIITETYLYNSKPLERRPRVVQLQKLQDRRGVFVIDVIGGGFQCRALVRKGELRFIQETDQQGYNFRVFTDEEEFCPTATITMDGITYEPTEDGVIRLPFSPTATIQNQMIILDDDQPGAATLHYFDREEKFYEFHCGVHVDRECLLEGKQATIVLKPSLCLNNEWCSIEEYTQQQGVLTYTTTDNCDEEINTVTKIDIYDDQPTTATFTVPKDCVMVDVKISIVVEGHTFTKNENFSFSTIDKTPCIADMFLYPYGRTGYVLAVLGKNGEAYPAQVLDLHIQHANFKQPLNFTVETDANGRVFLGRLYDCRSIRVTSRDPIIVKEQKWNLLYDIGNIPREINKRVGDTVKIPVMGTTPGGPKFEIFDKDYIQRFTDCGTFKDGFIYISGLPAGDFNVTIMGVRWQSLVLMISAGMETENEMGKYVINKNRALELSEDTPLQITKIVGNRYDGYRVSFEGQGPRTNMLVVATRFMPRFNMYNGMCSMRIDPDNVEFQDLMTTYTDQRELFGEYKYVLERSFNETSKQPGNMLNFPTFQTNGGFKPDPIGIRGGPPPADEAPPPIVSKIIRKANRERKADLFQYRGHTDISNIAFLPQQSYLTIFNAADCEGGEVIIDPKSIGSGHHLLTIIAMDEDNTSMRYKVLDATDEEDATADIRLQGLDPQRAFSELRKVVPLSAQGMVEIRNYQTADVQIINDRTSLFKYFLYKAAKEGNGQLKKDLTDFAFMTQWDALTNDEKLAVYDKFNCNEVNLYLRNVDPSFFNSAVKPLLQSKLVKTFFDLYLLEDMKKIQEVNKNIYIRQNMNYLERILLSHALLSAQPDPVDPAITVNYFKHLFATTADTPARDDELFEFAFQACKMSIPSIQACLPEAPPKTDLEPAGLRQLTQTKFESNYYKFQGKTQGITTANKFWANYASFMLDGSNTEQYFSSDSLLKTASSLNEMLLCMAVVDLPFRSDPQQREVRPEGTCSYRTETPCVMLIRQVEEVEDNGCPTLSIYAVFYDKADPTVVKDGVMYDKFLTDTFVTKRMYTCRVVLTNVFSEDQRCEILCQIPAGAIPLDTGFKTKNKNIFVEAFSTCSFEFSFYWPTAGTYQQFQPHVTKRTGTTVESFSAATESRQMMVSEAVEVLDRSSWRYMANSATIEDVLAFLAESPEAPSCDLRDICWRLPGDAQVLQQVVDTLKGRGLYSQDVWSYALLHAAKCPEILGEYLTLHSGFQSIIDSGFTSNLVSYNETQAAGFQFLEYAPVISKRGHNDDVSGTTKKQDISAQYSQFLLRVACSSTEPENISAGDQLILCYYLALMNKIVKCRELFEELDEEEGAAAGGWGYQYLRAYLALTQGEEGIDTAGELAEAALADKTITPSARQKWQDVQKVVADYKDQSLADDDFNEDGCLARAQALEPWLDFTQPIDNQLRFEYRNIDAFTVNYYATDIERLFSSHPFADQATCSYGVVAPTDVKKVKADDSGVTEMSIPKPLRESQMIVEVCYGPEFKKACVKPMYHNLMTVQISREIGEIRALAAEDGRPISGAYAKVYARLKTGETIFYKDGFTDGRGRFNYKKLTSSKHDGIAEKYSLLILDPDRDDAVGTGASVTEIPAC